MKASLYQLLMSSILNTLVELRVISTSKRGTQLRLSLLKPPSFLQVIQHD